MAKNSENNSAPALIRILEPVLVFCVILGMCGVAAPDVNEAQYLTKAKHFWNPDWCKTDHFLNSNDTHYVFYWTAGWLTRFLSLEQSAWTIRLVTWGAFAGAWTALSRAIAPHNWFSIASAFALVFLNRHFHLAGEWLVGGAEAKSIAYVFVLLALRWTLVGKFEFVFVWLGLAIAFHPLVGLWSSLSVIGARLVFGPRVPLHRRLWLFVTAGALVGLAGVAPAISMNLGSPAELNHAADRIYVESRISHHLWITEFASGRLLMFSAMLVAWAMLAIAMKNSPRQRLLNQVAATSLLVALPAVALGWLARQGILVEFSFSILRFYWFRWPDAMLSVAVSIGFVGCVSLVIDRIREANPGKTSRAPVKIIVVLMIACVATGLTVESSQRFRDPRPGSCRQALPEYTGDPRRTWETYRNWVRVCRWIESNTPSNAVFLTNYQQQTFKWYSGRAEIACWKDIPQDAAGICEWFDRINRLYYHWNEEFGILTHLNSELLELADRYDARYLVVPQKFVVARRRMGYPVPFTQIYPADSAQQTTYVVFRLDDVNGR